MLTIAAAVQAYSRLDSDSARLDVELLLCHCLDKPRSFLRAWPQRNLSAQQQQLFEALLARRISGEPVAYILGEREFWSLPLKVGPATLIPRPETELLVEVALELGPPGSCRVLDLGTGTGAIALALAQEHPDWAIYATDKNPQALALAQSNSTQLQLPIELLESDWFDRVSGQFDLIVSNPPYISADDPHLQQGDVRFEPHTALVAEDQGLGDLQRIVQNAPDYLTPGGYLVLEHGWQQGDAVVALLNRRGFANAINRTDLNLRPRISIGQWQGDAHAD